MTPDWVEEAGKATRVSGSAVPVSARPEAGAKKASSAATRAHLIVFPLKASEHNKIPDIFKGLPERESNIRCAAGYFRLTLFFRHPWVTDARERGQECLQAIAAAMADGRPGVSVVKAPAQEKGQAALGRSTGSTA